jgi:4-hydroxy-tetrahydrodipicolinate synthase
MACSPASAGRIEGVIPILQTPFGENGELDLDSLRNEVRYVCEAGAHGMAFPGFVSEWWKLSEEEIFTASRVIAETRTGPTKIVFNVTAQSTLLAVRQARRFLELGCDALMCLPPFVVPPGPEAAIEHVRQVLACAPRPHIIQYAASLTGLKLNPQSLVELRREFPHFSCLKIDFIPPGPTLTHLAQALAGEGFTFLIGYSGLQLADSIARGAHGLMGGAGHVREDLDVFRALTGGDPAAGYRAFRRLLPMLNFEMQTVDLAVAVHKRLLRDKGIFASDSVRAPGAGLDPYQVAELERHSRFLTD